MIRTEYIAFLKNLNPFFIWKNKILDNGFETKEMC